MHHYLQRKTVDAIARGEEPLWGGLYALYAPPADSCVANPPNKKLPRKLNLHHHIARWLKFAILYDVVFFVVL
jgi:hypothetical protein